MQQCNVKKCKSAIVQYWSQYLHALPLNEWLWQGLDVHWKVGLGKTVILFHKFATTVVYKISTTKRIKKKHELACKKEYMKQKITI